MDIDTPNAYKLINDLEVPAFRMVTLVYVNVDVHHKTDEPDLPYKPIH